MANLSLAVMEASLAMVALMPLTVRATATTATTMITTMTMMANLRVYVGVSDALVQQLANGALESGTDLLRLV